MKFEQARHVLEEQNTLLNAMSAHLKSLLAVNDFQSADSFLAIIETHVKFMRKTTNTPRYVSAQEQEQKGE